MYVDGIKEYEVDLKLSEKLRWSKIILKEQKIAKELAKAGMADLDEVTWVHRSPTVHLLFSMAYRSFGGLFMDEMKAWAKAMGVSSSAAVFLNCMYELCACMEYLGTRVMKPFGCTSGIKWVPGKGMVHVRSMDWPIPAIGPATRIFRFTQPSHDFISVGVTGMVNVISGMVPGAYSATINWAPSNESPGFEFGPSFLLRKVLTECDNYEDAVKELCGAQLAAPVFFSVCGIQKGQACVIERSREECVVRPYSSRPLVQANHYVSQEFQHLNDPIKVEDEDGSVMEDSRVRAVTLYREMHRPLENIDDAASCLDEDPVVNDQSYQQMAFCPATGEYRAWAWV